MQRDLCVPGLKHNGQCNNVTAQYDPIRSLKTNLTHSHESGAFVTKCTFHVVNISKTIWVYACTVAITDEEKDDYVY